MERLLLMNYRVKPTSLAKEKQSGDLLYRYCVEDIVKGQVRKDYVKIHSADRLAI